MTMSSEFTLHLENLRDNLEQQLDHLLPTAKQEPTQLHQAMRYSTLNAGKRLRPLLVYLTGEMFGANIEKLHIPAAAIEFIHCYTLIHDDLPAMDDDNERRGKPACHIEFDEATAILAGSSLFNLAYQIIVESKHHSDQQKLSMLDTSTNAVGTQGVAGGQALDLAANQNLTPNEFEHISSLKTSALFQAAVKLGAIASNAPSEEINILNNFAYNFGLAFQLKDDLADVEEITENKISYVALCGTEKTRTKTSTLKTQAINNLNNLKPNSEKLIALTELVLVESK